MLAGNQTIDLWPPSERSLSLFCMLTMVSVLLLSCQISRANTGGEVCSNLDPLCNEPSVVVTPDLPQDPGPSIQIISNWRQVGSFNSAPDLFDKCFQNNAKACRDRACTDDAYRGCFSMTTDACLALGGANGSMHNIAGCERYGIAPLTDDQIGSQRQDLHDERECAEMRAMGLACNPSESDRRPSFSAPGGDTEAALGGGPQTIPTPVERIDRSSAHDAGGERSPNDSPEDQAEGETEDPGSPERPRDSDNPSGADVDHSTQQAGEQLAQACFAAYREANTCCRSPLSCMGVDPSTQNDLGAGASIAGSSLANMMNSGNPDSIRQACATMKNTGYTSSGINAAGAAMCSDVKNGCVDVCENSKDTLRGMIRSKCGYDPAMKRGSCPGLQSAYDNIGSRQVSCTTFNANIAAMGKQASHSATSAQMAAKCEEQSMTTSPATNNYGGHASGGGGGLGGLPGLTAPGNGSSGGIGSGGGGYNSYANESETEREKRLSGEGSPLGETANFGSRPDEFNTADYGDVDGNTQAPLFDPSAIQQQSASSKGIPGGGGGGGVGGGASAAGFGGSGGGGKGGSNGSGYNTDVLKGYSGYSGIGGTGGGSRRGNSRGSAGTKFNGGLGFLNSKKAAAPSLDLKQFLPGGRRDPSRKIAGMTRTVSSEIAPRHANIWNNVSNKMRELCELKILYGCAGR